MIQTHYVSNLCDVHCEHHHRTFEAAEKCAARRVRDGELKRYCGPGAEDKCDDDNPAAMYVKKITR